jgi:hypothetical protein
MKKILVLLLVCALVFSLMISVTSCVQEKNDTDDNNQNNNNPDDNNPDDNTPDDNNPDDNKPDDNNPDDSPIVPDGDPVKDGTIETPPIPADSTDNRGK